MSKLAHTMLVIQLFACGTEADQNHRRTVTTPQNSADQQQNPDKTKENPGSENPPPGSKPQNEFDYSVYTNYGLVLDLTDEGLQFTRAEIKTEPENGRILEFSNNGKFKYFPNSNFYGYDKFVITIYDEQKSRVQDITINFAVHKNSKTIWKVRGDRRPVAGTCTFLSVERYGRIDELNKAIEVQIISSGTNEKLALFADRGCAGVEMEELELKAQEDQKQIFAIVPATPGPTSFVIEYEDGTQPMTKPYAIEIQAAAPIAP